MTGESMKQEEPTAKQLINLAWNASDKQHEALVKLEYFLMAHYAYFLNMQEDIGELVDSSIEVSGFYLTSRNLLEELKASSETIEKGFKASHGQIKHISF